MTGQCRCNSNDGKVNRKQRTRKKKMFERNRTERRVKKEARRIDSILMSLEREKEAAVDEKEANELGRGQ